MKMAKPYTNTWINTPFSVPTHFIDVRTGETMPVPPIVMQQIRYHSENQTLLHLVLSALTHYLQSPRKQTNQEAILKELAEIKQLLQNPNIVRTGEWAHPNNIPRSSNRLPNQEIESILEFFGG